MRSALWLVMLAAVPHASGAPMDTCDVQAECVDFTLAEAQPGAICGGEPCEFTVCLTLDQSGSCAKDGPVSYSCVKRADVCSPPAWFRGDGTETNNIPDGFEQCQTGRAGEELQFLLKDGRTCAGSSLSERPLPGGFGGATVRCAGSNSGSPSCTGNRKGCIWTVRLPSVCSQPPTPNPPAPTPNPPAPTPYPTPNPPAPTPYPTPNPPAPTPYPTPNPPAPTPYPTPNPPAPTPYPTEYVWIQPPTPNPPAPTPYPTPNPPAPTPYPTPNPPAPTPYPTPNPPAPTPYPTPNPPAPTPYPTEYVWIQPPTPNPPAPTVYADPAVRRDVAE